MSMEPDRSRGVFANPLEGVILGDPFILRHRGAFYLYGTNDGPPLPDGRVVPVFRSRDLIHWEASPLNPVLVASDDDRKVANPRLTDDQRNRVARAVDRNNSDVDFCEFRGRTVITYSWGAQQGTEFLAEAEKLKLNIDPLPGAEVQKVVERIYATPPDQVERARAALAASK